MKASRKLPRGVPPDAVVIGKWAQWQTADGKHYRRELPRKYLEPEQRIVYRERLPGGCVLFTPEHWGAA